MYTSLYDVDVEKSNREANNIRTIASQDKKIPIHKEALKELDKELGVLIKSAEIVDNEEDINYYKSLYSIYQHIDELVNLNIKLLIRVIKLRRENPDIIKDIKQLNKFVIKKYQIYDNDKIIKTVYSIKRYDAILQQIEDILSNI